MSAVAMGQPISHSPPRLDAVLAIDGGVPVRRMPPPSWPAFAEDEIAEVAETLRSGKVNQWTGERVNEFERTFAAAIGRPYGLALANGTVALETMLRAYDIGPGDEVIVTPRSFIASASSVDLVGAKPVFADVELDSEMITPATVAPLINSRTKAIVVVHLHGRPADMPGFLQLARRYRLRVFEDCAQAQGAKIDGQPVGSFGDAGAFSFCQDKIMTTGGEGGMVVLADRARWKRAWSRRENGKDYDAVYNRRHGPGYRWVYRGLGTNARMSEMQAAIGLRQLLKVEGWRAARAAHASHLAAALADYPSVCVSPAPAGCEHAYYRFAFRIKPPRLGYGWTRDLIIAALVAEGITCFAGPCPELYREHTYARGMRVLPRLANAAMLGEVSLTLLVHPTLDQPFLCDARTAIRKVLDAATYSSPRSTRRARLRRATDCAGDALSVGPG